MKDINIAQTLILKRKEKGITQEELAHYIGVSKASVSKWETGASYPDIAFLPQLATYFDISIDELMAYDPQMTPENIRATYRRLTSLVAERPYDDILEEVRGLAKRYYSCYPLLSKLGIFMLNNVNLIEDQEKRTACLREIVDIFERVHAESADPELSHMTLGLQGYTYLALNEPDMTLNLLEESARTPLMTSETIVAGAYQMKGETDKAKEVIQIGLYQNLILGIGLLSQYLFLSVDDDAAFEETVKRFRNMAESTHLDTLHPTILLSHELTIALAYAMRNDIEGSLDSLERFTRLALITTTYELHGDAYFNRIDSWLEDLDNGTEPPRNAASISNDLASTVATNPAFAFLQDQPRYKTIVSQLSRLKEDHHG